MRLTCLTAILSILTISMFTTSLSAGETVSQGVPQLDQQIAAAQKGSGPTEISIPKGVYHFYVDRAAKVEHYISNHDQKNPRAVGMTFENLKNVSFNANGSTFLFHGKMIPLVIKNCENCSFRNFSIDFVKPSITQAHILKNEPTGITIRLDEGSDYELRNGQLWFKGDGWEYVSGTGIAFDGKKRHLVYNCSDIPVRLDHVKSLGDRKFFCPNWKNEKLVPGTVFAFRPGERPAPGIFMYLNKNSRLENIKIHYAEGMGLLAQLCDGIDLNGVSVCLRGANDTRYFTTQADATHFSGCKGLLRSENSLFEGMMDDAINVHGTYLKVVQKVDERTLRGSYMHKQAWGFLWGTPGDRVQFINSETMEVLGSENEVASIRATDAESEFGARTFEIKFKDKVPPEISEKGTFGIENLTWAPEVIFRNNVIRNNRARGTLFSTPKKTLVEGNLFDHTSGTAILLCGDCNGWFETGACRDVLIRKNRFINSLACMFQFTNAIISIYPEIPRLDKQIKYFHGGKENSIVIEDNIFETFDHPIVYAKSVDGLTFRGNKIITNHDFKPFHWNDHAFLLERVRNFKLEKNSFDWKFDQSKDVLVK